MPFSRVKSVVKTGVTTALAAVVLMGVGGMADAAGPGGPTEVSPSRLGPAANASADAPSHTVEDFVHPGADDILAERGILLGHGDGHIALADCGGSGLIQLRSRDAGDVCFRAVGPVGHLSMRISSVYLIFGGDKNITAKLTAENGQSKTYDVAAGLWKPVGETDTGVEAALMEIRIA